MKLDLHVHSHFSHDGRMEPEALFAAAKKAGLAGLAVCDHNTLAGSREAQAMCPKGFVVIPGAEYSTDMGHVLAYFIDRGAEEASLPRLTDGRFLLADLARFVRAQGGLLVAAHPFRRRTVLPDTLLSCVDGLELFNARDLARRPESVGLTRTALEGTRLFACAGSDAHLPGEIGGAYIETRGSSAADVRAALTSGGAVCRGRPAQRRFEGLSRFSSSETPATVVSTLKNTARLAVFTACDLRDTVAGRRTWQSSDAAPDNPKRGNPV